MSRKFLFALLILSNALWSCSRTTEDPNLTTISIVGTNDLHGAILPTNGYGGLDVFSGYVNNLKARRAADGGAVVLVDAGDMWQGTLESNIGEGAVVVKAYNAIGYDAAAIGNHEFDYGPEGSESTTASESDDMQGALKARAREASFPILAANINDVASGKPVDWVNVSPSTVIEVAGVTVGIVGVITKNAFAVTHAAHTQGLRISPLAESIQREAQSLRQKGASIVIVTAHAGSECLEFSDPDDLTSCRTDDEIFQVAEQLPAGLVDVIVAGHVHEGIAHNVNGMSVISSYSRGKAFGRVDVVVDRNGMTVASKTVFPPEPICEFSADASGHCGSESRDAERSEYAGRAVTPDEKIAAVLSTAVAEVKEYKEREFAIDVEPGFRRLRIPESAIGNLVTDVMLETALAAEVAINNTVGGIRADMPPGRLTYGALYEVFPFDNRVVVLPISGADLRALFENQLTGRKWIVSVAGLRVQAECEAAELIVTMTKNDGRTVKDDDLVMVATTDFLALGGVDVFLPAMLPDGFNIDPDSPLLRQKLTEWFEGRSGTLRIADYHDPSEPRFSLPGSAPVTCPAGAS